MYFKEILFSVLIFVFIRCSFAYNCSPCTCEGNENEINVSCTSATTNGNNINIIPPILQNYQDEIAKMDFTGQTFTELKENDFTSFSNIKIIIVTNNRISFINPNTFKQLKLLLTLHLERNQITSLSSELFSNTIKIEYIFLNDNKITSLPKNLFKNLSNLKEVHLNLNYIENIEDNCFVNVPSLMTLDLSNNNLISLKTTFMDSIESLKLAYFDKNPWICNTTLCDLINQSIKKNWLRGRIPRCSSGLNWEQLQILEPLIQLPFQSPVNIHQNMILTCEINTCSQPKMLLSFNGRPLLNYTQCSNGNKHFLTKNLINITKEDQGSYTCSIENCGYCTNATGILEVSDIILVEEPIELTSSINNNDLSTIISDSTTETIQTEDDDNNDKNGDSGFKFDFPNLAIGAGLGLVLGNLCNINLKLCCPKCCCKCCDCDFSIFGLIWRIIKICYKICRKQCRKKSRNQQQNESHEANQELQIMNDQRTI